MTDLSDAELAAIIDGATPGPWCWDEEGFMGCGQVYTLGEGVEGASIAAPSGDCYPRSGYYPQGDMKLIAAAREALPALLARAQAAEAKVRAVEDE